MSRKVQEVLLYILLSAAGAAMIVMWPPGSLVLPALELDGQFEDWQGRSFLSDFPYDAAPDEDLRAVFWGTNRNERNLYFLIERFVPQKATAEFDCLLYFDINNNGHYEDRIDKFVEVRYTPEKTRPGLVRVEIYTTAGDLIRAYSGPWGETAEKGGRRFEFSVPMADLYISPPQVVRFYAAVPGLTGDRLPDRGDNQWTPFPVMSVQHRWYMAAAFMAWLAGTIFFYRHRIWVFYYIWGAVGFTFLSVLLMRGSLVEYRFEQYLGGILHHLLTYLDITTYVFDKAPGTILVLIKVDNSWTTIDIDIESSGLMEMLIFLGLLFFYPAYSIARKAFYGLAGVFCVILINLVRLIVVISTIHWGGRNLYFIAHTLVGRVVFFVLIVALYWYILTRPSLQKVKESIKEHA